MKIYIPFLSLVLLFTSQPSLACRCTEPSINTAYTKADLVVQATAREVTNTPAGDGVSVLLEVSNTWKKDSTDKITVNSRTGCYYPFEKGHTYILFLTIEPNGLYSTGRCFGNKQLSESDKLKQWLDDIDRH